MARERIATDAWRRLSDQSRLVGKLARAISAADRFSRRIPFMAERRRFDGLRTVRYA
jgi:hypothetical protein